MKHSPTPFKADNEGRITDERQVSVAYCCMDTMLRREDKLMQANAEYIIRACNNYERLVAALKPFAAVADEKCLRNKRDDYPQFGLNDVLITVGDFRKASSLLKELEV